MPNPNTFSIKPISDLLDRWLPTHDGVVIVDPFARDSARATHTNDLSPQSTAQHHLPAPEYLDLLLAQGVRADAVLLDPPYSPRQMSEAYKGAGLRAGMNETQNARLYRECKDRMDALLKPGGLALTLGWNSSGFGLKRGYEMLEILLVCGGAAHNDYICVVERKFVPHQGGLPL